VLLTACLHRSTSYHSLHRPSILHTLAGSLKELPGRLRSASLADTRRRLWYSKSTKGESEQGTMRIRRLWQGVAVLVSASRALRPCHACTAFDMSSSGFASSLWHMIPALGLFAENGTFFVRPASCCLHTLPFHLGHSTALTVLSVRRSTTRPSLVSTLLLSACLGHAFRWCT